MEDNKQGEQYSCRVLRLLFWIDNSCSCESTIHSFVFVPCHSSHASCQVWTPLFSIIGLSSIVSQNRAYMFPWLRASSLTIMTNPSYSIYPFKDLGAFRQKKRSGGGHYSYLYCDRSWRVDVFGIITTRTLASVVDPFYSCTSISDH